MIKTDKVMYKVGAQKEYYWLMDKLEAAGCEWLGGGCPSDDDETWILDISDYCIWVEKKTISYSEVEFFYDYYKDRLDYEIIEVSDLMENEKKNEVLDKLEAMNKYLDNELENLEKEDDESQKIKKIVYTTEVYFE